MENSGESKGNENMKRRNRKWATRVPTVAFIFCLLLGITVGRADETPAVLFVGDSGNHVASGLQALQVPFDESSVADLVQGNACLFDSGAMNKPPRNSSRPA